MNLDLDMLIYIPIIIPINISIPINTSRTNNHIEGLLKSERIFSNNFLIGHLNEIRKINLPIKLREMLNKAYIDINCSDETDLDENYP